MSLTLFHGNGDLKYPLSVSICRVQGVMQCKRLLTSKAHPATHKNITFVHTCKITSEQDYCYLPRLDCTIGLFVIYHSFSNKAQGG